MSASSPVAPMAVPDLPIRFGLGEFSIKRSNKIVFGGEEAHWDAPLSKMCFVAELSSAFVNREGGNSGADVDRTLLVEVVTPSSDMIDWFLSPLTLYEEKRLRVDQQVVIKDMHRRSIYVRVGNTTAFQKYAVQQAAPDEDTPSTKSFRVCEVLALPTCERSNGPSSIRSANQSETSPTAPRHSPRHRQKKKNGVSTLDTGSLSARDVKPEEHAVNAEREKRRPKSCMPLDLSTSERRDGLHSAPSPQRQPTRSTSPISTQSQSPSKAWATQEVESDGTPRSKGSSSTRRRHREKRRIPVMMTYVETDEGLTEVKDDHLPELRATPSAKQVALGRTRSNISGPSTAQLLPRSNDDAKSPRRLPKRLPYSMQTAPTADTLPQNSRAAAAQGVLPASRWRSYR